MKTPQTYNNNKKKELWRIAGIKSTSNKLALVTGRNQRGKIELH